MVDLLSKYLINVFDNLPELYFFRKRNPRVRYFKLSGKIPILNG